MTGNLMIALAVFYKTADGQGAQVVHDCEFFRYTSSTGREVCVAVVVSWPSGGKLLKILNIRTIASLCRRVIPGQRERLFNVIEHMCYNYTIVFGGLRGFGGEIGVKKGEGDVTWPRPGSILRKTATFLNSPHFATMAGTGASGRTRWRLPWRCRWCWWR